MKKVTPHGLGLYKIAIQLFKTYNFFIASEGMDAFKLAANIHI
jgi:hypothetical protein